MSLYYKILPLLILLAGLIAGCSTENPDAVFGAHPAGWLSTHGTEANANVTNCQSCHGLDFAGSGNIPGCLECHIEGPPFGTHPLGWINVQQDHQSFSVNYSWTSCATSACHDSTLQGGTTGPSCFNASAQCHVNTGGNPPAAHNTPYTSPALHGLAGKDNLLYCQNCHGRPLNNFSGGFVANLFPDATPEINNDGNCSSCHPDATAHATNWTLNSNTSNLTHAAAGNKETACVICHNLTINTTPGNNTPGPLPGAPSCFSTSSTNANLITSGCHPSGPGVFHDVGQDWLLPTGHVGAALLDTPPCFTCHTQTAAGAGINPACQDCHTAGDPFIVTNCTSCHNTPPDSLAPQGASQPNLIGKHDIHDGFTATTTDCTACHVGGGTGNLNHYDRADQTTPNLPAHLAFLPFYTAKTGGAASYNDVNQTCSNIGCHGGQTTPDWTTGTISLTNDCTSCHRLATVSDQFNSYGSGRHSSHAETGGHADDLGFNPTCSACHNAANLPASDHFSNLDTAVVEGNPIATLLTGLSYDNTTDPANPTCTTNIAVCHSGEIRIWGAAAAAPHPVDDSYRASTAHGPDAKLNQSNCQTCHATPTSGGPNPQFTVNIIQNKSGSLFPARDTTATGCEKCHNVDTAHPSDSAGEQVRWYDAAPDNLNVTHNDAGGNVAAVLNANCGLCHSGLSGSVGNVGPDCTFCHVVNPVGFSTGSCTSCHNRPPNGNSAPNRKGTHDKGAHRLDCSICHTNDGPDGSTAAAEHFTYPNPNYGRADLRSVPNTSPQSMTITPTGSDVTCNSNCHGKDHDNKQWY
jgi:predicted CxxxxCH...CXXCH cytochrome family protein